MINFLKKPFLIIFLLTFISISYSQERAVNSLNSQERIVTGYVTTLKKIALAQAEVKVSSSKVVVFTDTTGYFKISCAPKDKIKISAKGFLSQKINLDEKTKELSINLNFKPSEKNVDLAIGYGHIKEKDKSYSVTSIQNDGVNSKFSRYNNVLDIILDSSPSVTIKNGIILIRGEGSLNGYNGALIMLNGNEITMSQLSAIEPLQVKSVDILKGASSSIYGTRGANGVVLITTK